MEENPMTTIEKIQAYTLSAIIGAVCFSPIVALFFYGTLWSM
jgi:hypothetical protein